MLTVGVHPVYDGTTYVASLNTVYISEMAEVLVFKCVVFLFFFFVVFLSYCSLTSQCLHDFDIN